MQLKEKKTVRRKELEHTKLSYDDISIQQSPLFFSVLSCITPFVLPAESRTLDNHTCSSAVTLNPMHRNGSGPSKMRVKHLPVTEHTREIPYARPMGTRRVSSTYWVYSMFKRDQITKLL